MPKILITGAGGFVGQILAEHLLNDGHKVVLADIFEPPIPTAASNKENATCIKADLSEDPSSVLSTDLDALYVFHGIMSAGSEENLELGYRVNLHSTFNLLEAIRKTIPGVRSIIVVDIHQVGTSCGFSVPVYEYKAYRNTLNEFAEKRVANDEAGNAAEGMER